MGGLNGSSSLQNFAYSNRQLTVSPFSYLHVSSTYSDSNLVGLNGPSTSSDANHHHHQRCSSEDSLFEEEDQPSWFEDLLGEPEITPNPSKGHRRSASESYASFLGTAADIKEESSSSSTTSKSDNHEKEETNNIDALTEKGNIVPSKTDSKRAKQQSAHRSRVRKLKYIAELERTVQLLQGEGSEIQAELEFINQQNLILSMENRALRQRLDGLSQEQLIKHFEQEMLERELTRLQTLYQLQSKQQMQMQQISQHNRTKSRDLETHFANFTIRNNEMGTNKGSAATSIRI